MSTADKPESYLAHLRAVLEEALIGPDPAAALDAEDRAAIARAVAATGASADEDPSLACTALVQAMVGRQLESWGFGPNSKTPVSARQMAEPIARILLENPATSERLLRLWEKLRKHAG